MSGSDTTFRAHLVAVLPKENAAEITQQQLPDVAWQIVDEGVLKDFLENQYDLAAKILHAHN